MFQETYSLDSGIHCLKCPAGTRVVDDCHDNLAEPVCAPCLNHRFSDAPNGEKHCKLCRSSCPKYGKQVQDCTNRTNRVCTCQPGYHRYPLDDIDQHFDFECQIHSKCKEGYGEVYQGKWDLNERCGFGNGSFACSRFVLFSIIKIKASPVFGSCIFGFVCRLFFIHAAVTHLSLFLSLQFSLTVQNFAWNLSLYFCLLWVTRTLSQALLAALDFMLILLLVSSLAGWWFWGDGRWREKREARGCKIVCRCVCVDAGEGEKQSDIYVMH